MPETHEYTELKGFRYERKYLSNTYDSFQVEQIVKMHPAAFSEIYKERYINNVYFDTPRFDFYYDNVSGRFDRIKFRIRWYGNLYGNIEHPILEMKIKRGLVGTKRSFVLAPFKFTKDFKLSKFDEIIKKSELPQNTAFFINNIKPSIINRYSRKYFNDFNKEYRITIDKNILYIPTQNQIKLGRFNYSDKKTSVIELKYDKKLNHKANKISEKLPFRLTKNSKYVTGIELFYDVLD